MILILLFAWVLLPAAALARALALPIPVTTAVSRASVRSLHTDNNRTTHTSVSVSCPNCSVAQSASPDQLSDLSLDFSIAPGSEPCSSNLSLNSVPLNLAAPWAFQPRFARGSTNLNASGHGLVVDWYKACIEAEGGSNSPDDPAQVLSFTVNSVDGHRVDVPSLAGFTVSFKDVGTVQLLRLESPPVHFSDINDSWRNPPSALRIELPEEVEHIIQDTVLRDHLRELQQLEAEVDQLKKLVRDKKQVIADLLESDLKQKVENCDGFFCVAKTILHHIRQSAHLLYHKLRPSSFDKEDKLAPGRPHRQKPAMIIPATGQKNSPNFTGAHDLPSFPEKCHCKEEQKGGHYLRITEEEDADGFRTESQLRDVPVSKIWIILQFILFVTGLALLFRLCRRCCTSPRKRRDRAARREQRRTEREYRCASRRLAFWDWIKGRKRGTPGRRPGDLEEKSALVGQQEAYLEEHMEDEIRQLKIHEEIRHLQSTREAVTDMIRAAEEGRLSAAPPYNTNPFADSPYHTTPSVPPPTYPPSNPFAHPHTGFPRPIIIPSRQHGAHDHALASPISSNDMAFSPISRTTSLPSYRSKPPSYRENASSDGFGSDSETQSTDGEWAHSDNSSIPDLSPRPSGETLRTFL